MLKTTFYIFFAVGAFIASCDAEACQEDDDCATAPPGLTRDIDGQKMCCMSGSIGVSTSTTTDSTGQVTKTVTCTCSGGGSSGGSSGGFPGGFPWDDAKFDDIFGGSGGPGGNTPGGPSIPSLPKVEETPLDEFRQASLEEHNRLRALHGSPPLKLADDLNEFAQNYAEQLVKLGRLQHSDGILPSTGEELGENLATMMGSAGADFKGPDAVKMWYDEIKDYNFDSPGFSHGTGHFTQVVWKASTELGMGKARSADGTRVYAVGSYRPAGNFQGRFAENVLPPSSG